jgi:hypothetical protein
VQATPSSSAANSRSRAVRVRSATITRHHATTMTNRLSVYTSARSEALHQLKPEPKIMAAASAAGPLTPSSIAPTTSAATPAAPKNALIRLMRNAGSPGSSANTRLTRQNSG